MRCCISYLLLHNKLPQNLVAQRNKHVLPRFLWVRNPGVVLQSHLNAQQGGDLFLSSLFWLLAHYTVPHHIIPLQHGNCDLPHNIPIWFSLEWVIQKRECSWQKPHSLYNLISEMASHCFCYILITKLVTKPSPHSLGWLP